MADINLGTAYIELASSTKGLNRDIKNAFSEAQKYASEFGGHSSEQVKKGFGGVGDAIGSGLDGAKGKVSGFFSGIGSMASNVMTGVAMGFGIKIFDTVSGALGKVFNMSVGAGIDRYIAIDQAEAKLTGLGHSAETVETIMDNALASVKGTAFGMGEASTAAAGMVAAGIKPGEQLTDVLTLVGDAATIAGTDFDSMGSIFNKVAASNKLQMDSINQLQDQGVPVLQFVADHLGVTADEARQMASAGEVSFDTFAAAMEAGLGGAAQASGETFMGALGNVKAALGRIGVQFMGPIMDAVKPLMGALIPAIDGLGEALAPVAARIGEWVAALIPRLISWIERLPDMFSNVSNRVSGFGDVFAKVGAWWTANGQPMFNAIAGIIRDYVIPAFISIGGWIKDVGIPAFMTIVGYIRDNFMPIFRVVAGYIADRIVPVFQTVAYYITSIVVPTIMKLVTIAKERLNPIFRDVAQMIEEKVLPTLDDIGRFIRDKVIPTVKDFAERILIPAFDLIGKAVGSFWNDIGKPVFDNIWTILRDYVGPTISWLWTEVVDPTFTLIGDAIQYFSDNWEDIWNKIRNQAAKPVNFVIETVWNNGIRKIINAIPGVDDVSRLNTIPTYQSGGYVNLPWSASKRDPYLGYTPGGMFRFEGEEFIFPRDFTKKHRDSLEAMLRGDMEVPGYARGGAVRPVPQGHTGWNGGQYRRGGWHGGLDFPAPTGTPISAMWGGSVSRALRLNRSYGHHAILSHGDGLQTLYAHMSRLGVSAGQAVAGGQTIGRVGSTGNSTGPHLHLEVRLNGRQIDPTPYLSGASAPTGTGEGDDPGLISMLMGIPGQITGLIKTMREHLTGDWGEMIRDSISHSISGLWDTLKSYIPGFAGGTHNAPAGWAMVGERGPELVRFGGGEQVLPHERTRRAVSGGASPDMDDVLAALMRMTEEFSGLRSDIQAQRRLAYQGGY